MKANLISITLFFFVSSTLACSNNPSFDLCKQTATIALSQCDTDQVPVKCQCSAQKQLLACYSECAGDVEVLGLQKEQRQTMVTTCAQPGAEAEVKMRKKNNVKDTMGVPVRVSEPFTVKPKLQSVSIVDDGGADSPAQEYQAPSTEDESQPTTSNNNMDENEKLTSDENNKNDASQQDTFSDSSSQASSSGVSQFAVVPGHLFAMLYTMFYLL